MSDTITGFRRLRLARVILALLLPLVLVACGEDEELIAQRERFEAYTQADLEALFAAGEGREVLAAINHYRNQGTANSEHLFLMAKVYLRLGGGIAAEETIYKLHDRGYDERLTALTLAQALVLQGKHAEAEEVLKKTEIADDQKYSGLILQGDIMMSLGEYDQAEALYMAAVESEPSAYRGHLAASLFYLQRGNLAEAQAYAEQAHALEHEDPLVSYALAMVARYSGRIAEAKSLFFQAIEANGSDTLSRLEVTGILIAGDEFEAAQQQLDAIYSLVPNNPLADYYTALLLVREQRFDEAEDLLLRAGDFTRYSPLSAQVYGFVTYELGKYSTAIPYLERALAVFPFDVNTRLALADSMGRRGQSQEALDVLAPLLQSGNNVTALVHATAAAAGLGNISDARRYIEQAVELAKANGITDPETINNLTQRAAFARFLDDDLDSAAALLDAMYASDPNDSQSLTNKANLYLAAGEVEQAQVALDQLMALDPTSAVAANLQGAIYHRQKRFDEAITSYSAAISSRPEYQSALKNRAFAYIQKEDYPKARSDIEKILTLSQPDAQTRAMYGRALLETGDAAKALDYIDQALEDLPDFFIAHADRAEALAELEFFSRAISAAATAKAAAPFNAEFNTYMDEKIVEWKDAQEALEAAAAAERAERAEKAAQARQEELARQQAILDEAGDLLDEEEDQSELMAELEAIAEENRKLREEEEAAALEAALKANELTPEQVAKMQEEQRIRNARNQLFGLWLAAEVGLTGDDALAYTASILEADESEPGDTDIIRKALSDLEEGGKTFTIQSVEKKLEEFMAQAQSAEAEASEDQ